MESCKMRILEMVGKTITTTQTKQAKDAETVLKKAKTKKKKLS